MKKIWLPAVICLLLLTGCGRKAMLLRPMMPETVAEFTDTEETNPKLTEIPEPAVTEPAVPETEAEPTVPEVTETTAPEVPEEANALPEEVLRQIEAAFTQDFEIVDEIYPETNWLNMALWGNYETGAQVDLGHFLSEGAGGADRNPELSQAETDFLSTQEQVHLSLDVSRISREKANEALERTFGLALPDMDGVGLEKLAYFPETNCYYYTKGDLKFADPVEVTGGWETEDGLWKVEFLTGGICRHRITMEPDTFVILSNEYLNQDELE